MLAPVLQHLLETRLQQNQLSQEMALGLHVATQELMTLWQMAPAIATPLPNPAQDTQCLLTKLTGDDDIKAFLGTFKRVAFREGWPEREWANALAPLLTGDAQQAYHALPNDGATNHPTLSDEILAC